MPEDSATSLSVLEFDFAEHKGTRAHQVACDVGEEEADGVEEGSEARGDDQDLRPHSRQCRLPFRESTLHRPPWLLASG
eukprot:2603472-Rhodomonas_salina.1